MSDTCRRRCRCSRSECRSIVSISIADNSFQATVAQDERRSRRRRPRQPAADVAAGQRLIFDARASTVPTRASRSPPQRCRGTTPAPTAVAAASSHGRQRSDLGKRHDADPAAFRRTHGAQNALPVTTATCRADGRTAPPRIDVDASPADQRRRDHGPRPAGRPTGAARDRRGRGRRDRARLESQRHRAQHHDALAADASRRSSSAMATRATRPTARRSTACASPSWAWSATGPT